MNTPLKQKITLFALDTNGNPIPLAAVPDIVKRRFETAILDSIKSEPLITEVSFGFTVPALKSPH